jgi:predicted DNA-binding transcriptional regulator YafY
MYWARHLVKVLKAVEILSKPGGATMDELGKGLEVDRRTSYRIKETLEELNFPLYEDSSSFDGRKRFRFTDSYLKKLPNLNIPELELSLSELIALYFIRGNRRIFKGTDIEHNIDAAFRKLDAFMPEGLAERLEQVKTLFVPSSKFTKDYKDKEKIIDQLTDAIFRQQTCTVEYHSFHDDKTKGFKIDPLRFFERDGGLYLFVRATKYGHIRVLAVERIIKLAASKETFTAPKEFDPDMMLEDAFSIVYDEPVEVKIRFTKEVARYIKERKWAKEQNVIEDPAGTIILELKTSGWFDVKKWILSFGASAELLEPQEYRLEIAEELSAAHRKYDCFG